MMIRLTSTEGKKLLLRVDFIAMVQEWASYIPGEKPCSMITALSGAPASSTAILYVKESVEEVEKAINLTL